MTHHDFMTTVRRIARSNWGKEFASSQEAERELVSDPGKLGAFAMVELLHRLDAVANAIGGGERECQCGIAYRDSDGRYPGVEVGGSLFDCYAVEDGVLRYLVVHRDDEDRCFIVPAGQPWMEHPPRVRIAPKGLFLTAQEALQNGITKDEKYCSEVLARVSIAREAIEAGNDLSEFME